MTTPLRLSVLFAGAMLLSPALAIEVTGIVHYANVARLGIPVSGVVEEVNVTAGQRVTRGDLLVALEQVPFTAALQRNQAEEARLAAERDESEKALSRNQDLYDRMSLSTVDLDHSKLELTRAENRWEAQRAMTEMARYQLDKSRLHAPFDGLVLSVDAYPGMAVSSELQVPVLVQLADTSRFVVDAEVEGDRLGTLGHGDVLQVRIGANEFAGRVTNVDLVAEGRSLAQPSRYHLRVMLDAGAPGLRPGLQATLILPGPGQP